MPRRRTHPDDTLTIGGIALLAAVAFTATWWTAPLLQTLTMSAEERAAIERSVTYAGCDEVRLLGKAPLRTGEPGYRSDMDGDGDGVACEPYR